MAGSYYESWGSALARRILIDCVELKKGERLVIEAWTRNLPWVDSFLVEARRVGALALVIYESDAAYWESYENGWLNTLGTFTSLDRAILENTDAYVYLYGPSDRSRLLTLPPDKFKQLTAFEREWFKLAAERKLRWCRIEITRATPKLAREYGVDYDKWMKELFEASMVDPKELLALGNRLAKKIEGGSSLRITHPNGTNLELRFKKRKCFVWDGVAGIEMASGHGSSVPSGAALTSVDEGFAQGQIISNQVTRFGTGRGVGVGIKWVFEKGSLKDYSYEEGASEFLKDLKDIGRENAKPAIFSIGLNPKIRRAPLFEIYEKGTISFAIGSNVDLGGETNGHDRSWITLRGANVSIDRDAIIRAGKIL